MTQKEFDNEMIRINTMQNKEKNELFAEMDKLDAEKRTLLEQIKMKKNEMEAIYIQLSALKDRRGIYTRKLRESGARYHEMKHQLIVENPKESMEND